MPQFSKLQVYANGGMINFATEDGTLLRSEPKGSVRFLPWSVSGFTFEHLETGANIGYVAAYDDVLDSTGATYGVSQTAVAEALGLFFLADGGGAAFAKYNKQSWQTFTQSLPAFTTVAAYANALLGYYITVEEDTDITQLQARVSTGAVGSAVFGVYSLNAVGYPDALLFQTAVIDTNLVTPQVTVTAQTLPAGSYFVAMNSTTAACSFVALTAASVYNSFAGVSSAVGTTGYLSGYYIANAYNDVMPATFPAAAGLVGLASFPFITFKTAA